LREGYGGCVAALPERSKARSSPPPLGAHPKNNSMDITLNNIPEHLETGKAVITVSELLAIKRFTFKMLVVKINGKLIKKNEYSSATIKNGDDVQVIHLISGG